MKLSNKTKYTYFETCLSSAFFDDHEYDHHIRVYWDKSAFDSSNRGWFWVEWSY